MSDRRKFLLYEEFVHQGIKDSSEIPFDASAPDLVIEGPYRLNSQGKCPGKFQRNDAKNVRQLVTDSVVFGLGIGEEDIVETIPAVFSVYSTAEGMEGVAVDRKPVHLSVIHDFLRMYASNMARRREAAQQGTKRQID